MELLPSHRVFCYAHLHPKKFMVLSLCVCVWFSSHPLNLGMVIADVFVGIFNFFGIVFFIRY